MQTLNHVVCCTSRRISCFYSNHPQSYDFTAGLVDSYGDNANGRRGLLTSDLGLGVSVSDDDNNNEREMFDRTNMFHWCPPQSLEDACLVSFTWSHS